MSKVKCYSVRLESLISISEKAYKATAFDGTTAIIPKSQVFGQDYDVQKSDAYWISSWILEQKELQYSSKKESWFEKELSHASNEGVEIERHIPEEKEALEVEPIAELVKEDKIVKGYYLRWEEVRIAINRFGKLATKKRQHINTYEGVESKAPKGFEILNDEHFAVAKLREGKMIEPYTTPDFTALPYEVEKLKS
jgi:hypothetical protein